MCADACLRCGRIRIDAVFSRPHFKFIGAGFGLLNDSPLFSMGLYETKLIDSSCVVTA